MGGRHNVSSDHDDHVEVLVIDVVRFVHLAQSAPEYARKLRSVDMSAWLRGPRELDQRLNVWGHGARQRRSCAHQNLCYHRCFGHVPEGHGALKNFPHSTRERINIGFERFGIIFEQLRGVPSDGERMNVLRR